MPARLQGGYDFVDVRDVARGHILACEKAPAGGRYILHGEWISVDGIMDELSRATGVPVPGLRVPRSLARVAAALFSWFSALTGARPPFNVDSFETLQSNSLVRTDRAEVDLGFHARPVRESLRDTVAWFRQTGQLPPIN